MPTTQVRIYGASDDCIEIEGDITGADEFYISECTDFALIGPTGASLFFTVDYCVKPESEWTIRVENSTTHPEWPMMFTNRPGYDSDPMLVVDVPAGTRLVPRNGFSRD